jgi:RNase P/RNase MRP subunit p29
MNKIEKYRAELVGLIVNIVADDEAEDRGFSSKFVGKSAKIVDVKPNPRRNDGIIPVYEIDRKTYGNIRLCAHLWWSK